MIVSGDFIWLHFPKTGGTALEAAIKKLRPDAVADPRDYKNVIWHDGIARRSRRDPGFDPAGKRILCGFRRLPHWLLSRVHYEAARSRGIAPPARELLLAGRFHNAAGGVQHADVIVGEFATPAPDFWLRPENLKDDLAAALDVPLADVVAALTRNNEARIDYIRDMGFWFTSAELRGLYSANPLWASIEEKTYGSLLV